MSDNTLQPRTIIQAAAHKAIRIGFWCSVSFLCSVRGLAMLGNIAGLMAFYNLYRSLLSYRLLEQDIKFGKCLQMAFLMCIFAGLLTNVTQYVYFQFFDNGFFLSSLATIMESPEYQQMIKNIFSNVPQSELDAAFQQINVPVLMTQIIFLNLMLSVPVSLITAAFAAIPKINRVNTNQSEQNIEKE